MQFGFLELIEPGQIALIDLPPDFSQFRFLLIGFQLLTQGLQGALILILQLLRLTQGCGGSLLGCTLGLFASANGGLFCILEFCRCLSTSQ